MKKLKDKRTKDPRKGSITYFWEAEVARPKWASCVHKVDKKGGGKNPYAICTSQLGIPEKKKEKKEEADNSTGFTQLTRAGVKKESAATTKQKEMVTLGRFVEKSDAKPKEYRVRVNLIQEGLGNTKDGYYYTKQALKSAIPVFEGKKAYADHPTRTEEDDRPERSTRDIIGHYENVSYGETEDHSGFLEADLVAVDSQENEWAKGLIEHALKYSKKYSDQDFIGLSINASGESIEVEAEEFLESHDIPVSAKKKLEDAIKEGLNEVKVVNAIDEAVSCDLVTEAGAKGKIKELLEAEKMSKAKNKENDLKKKKKMAESEAEEAEGKKEAESEAEEAEGEDAGSKDAKGAGDHSDEEQDKALVMDMLKKQGLLDDESDDEHKERAMKAAGHYMQAYEAAGHEKPEALKRAVEAMQMAGKVHEAMESEAGEAKDKECKENESESEAEEKHKESASVIKLQGEVASLREALTKRDIADHIENKLKESKLPSAVTKKFREALKNPKSVKEVDDKFKLFMEGYKLNRDEEGLTITTEKETRESSDAISLEDCFE